MAEVQECTDAFYICEEILRNQNIISGTPFLNGERSERAKLLGEEMANAMKNILFDVVQHDVDVERDEEMIANVELDDGQDYEQDDEENEMQDGEHNENEYDDDEENEKLKEEKNGKNGEIVPFETKKKIVELARSHPRWSLKTLQQRGCAALKRKDQLKEWERQVAQNGTRREKIARITEEVNRNFTENKQDHKHIPIESIRGWAFRGKKKNMPVKFQASHHWVQSFKAKHGIRKRKITKYVKSKGALDEASIHNAVTNFREVMCRKMQDYDPDLVINTDQSGVEYRIDVKRTYAYKGEKSVEVCLGDLNKVSHSYTVQYSITASGKLLPHVFICLRENTKDGKFGPHVQKAMDRLTALYKNVVIVSTKSGKMNKFLFKKFVKTVVKPYCGNRKFLLAIDSWGGQTDQNIFQEVCKDEDGNATADVEIVPKHCTPIAQPCDVFFYRLVKDLLKKIQNYLEVLESGKQLSSREDVIKIHALIHFIFSSIKFQNMIRYAWHKSGLLAGEKPHFESISQVCFPRGTADHECENCDEGNFAFIVCSHCSLYLCFKCFYVEYHPQHCADHV